MLIQQHLNVKYISHPIPKINIQSVFGAVRFLPYRGAFAISHHAVTHI